MKAVVRVAHMLHGCRTLGPGARTVVWVRGCARRCPGCIASPILDPGPALELEPAELVARVLESGDEGVTFSGGEPLEQAGPLAAVAQLLRSEGRSVMVYTGFVLEELREAADLDVQRLLALTDILIDGAFEHARQADLLWRGSSNQRVHLLSRRHEELADQLDEPGAGVEVRLDRANNLFWAGVPTQGFVSQLRRAAEERGIEFTGHEGIWA